MEYRIIVLYQSITALFQHSNTTAFQNTQILQQFHPFIFPVVRFSQVTGPVETGT